MIISIFNIKSGEVLRVVDCSATEIALQFIKDQENFLNRDLTGYYIVNGVPVKMASQPSELHVFNFATKQWVLDLEDLKTHIRNVRKRLLAESDWMVVKAQETGTAVPEAWLNYRQALRDVTLQSNPLALVWPKSP